MTRDDGPLVHVVCKRFVDMERSVVSTSVRYVFADKDDAVALLTDKQAKNDFNWFVVSKKLRLGGQQ